MNGATKVTLKVLEQCRRDAPGQNCYLCDANIVECLDNLKEAICDMVADEELEVNCDVQNR